MKISYLPLVCAFFISMALIGFAITIYKGDHVTALTVISVVGGHWLGVGSFATGKTFSELANSTAVQTIKDASELVKGEVMK